MCGLKMGKRSMLSIVLGHSIFTVTKGIISYMVALATPSVPAFGRHTQVIWEFLASLSTEQV